MDTITIKMPLPSRDLSPNARVHYFRKARAAKHSKEMAFYLAKEQGVMERTHSWESAELFLTYTYKVKRTRDCDNALAMAKNAIDGVVAAGLLVNDSGIVPQPVQFVIGSVDGLEMVFRKLEAI